MHSRDTPGQKAVTSGKCVSQVVCWVSQTLENYHRNSHLDITDSCSRLLQVRVLYLYYLIPQHIIQNAIKLPISGQIS